ncbi:MAG: LysR family transcriptional regulator [Lachnospiraceae bacterium]|nr:LysR family transcriptional regulator [Lachnospiraceae bacterium]
MSISYEYYKIFYYAALHKNFSKAANELHNSQPNITRIIGNLEDELGCKLFERSNKGLTLTRAGETLFYYVNSAHKILQLGERELTRKGEKQISLGLSIGISRSILYDFVLPIIKDFDTKFPDVTIKLYNNSAPNLVDHTRDGMFDLSLLTDVSDDLKGIKKNIIGSFTDYLICGSSYMELYRDGMPLKELERLPLICLREGTETYAFYRNWFIKLGLTFSPHIEVATVEQVLSFVKQDMGFGFIFPKYAEEAIAKGEVYRVLTDEPIPSRELTLIKRRDNADNAYADILEEMIMASRHKI